MGNHRITVTVIGSTPTIQRLGNRFMDDLHAAGLSPIGNVEHLAGDSSVETTHALTYRPPVTVDGLLSSASVAPAVKNVLQFFRYDHLRPEMQVVSKMFAELACALVINGPSNAELTVALRKLLESKDAAVRASFSAY